FVCDLSFAICDFASTSWFDVARLRLGQRQVDLDALEGDGLADVAGLIDSLDAEIELVRQALGHAPGVLAGVGELVGDGAPGAFARFGIGQADRSGAEVLVARVPGGGQLALIDAGADLHIGDLHDRLREIDLDPELRPLAGLRRADAEADAALGDERDAVDALVGDLEGELLGEVAFTRVLQIDRILAKLGPGAALVEGVPEFDGRDAG